MSDNNLKASLLWASVATAAAGFIFYNVMPLYLGQLQESTGLTTSQIGLIASAFFFGFNIASFSSYFWVRKLPPFQMATAGTLTLLVFLMLANYSNSFLFQMIVTAAIGGISGAVGSIGVTIAGDADNNTRWYGIQVAAEAAAGVVLLFVLPVTLIPSYGFAGVIYGMIIMIVILLPAYLFLTRVPLPVGGADQAQPGAAVVNTQQAKFPVWVALVAMTLLFVSSAAVWAFVERIAAINAFDPEAVGRLLGISLFFAVVGSLAAGAAGDRFGNVWPYIANCLLLLVGVMTIALTDDLLVYAVGACIFMFGWAAAFAFLFAIIADLDPDGKHIALSVPALGVGSMIGPGMAGFLLSEGSTASLQLMCVVTMVASVVLAWISSRETVS
ncbi:MAG: MFS family permease [Alcanivorax sp.]